MDTSATDEKTTLAVIVISYNVRDLLRRCLTTLQAELARLPHVRAQVWVVDNASHDGSAGMVRSDFPDVRLLAQENRGFAAGNNAALRALGFEDGSREWAVGSRGDSLLPTPYSLLPTPDFVLLLNPDTETPPGALASLLDFMARTPQAGAVVPQLRYGDGRFQHSAFKLPGLAQLWLEFFPRPGRFVASRLNGRYPRRRYDAGRPFAIECGLGAALLVRGQAIRQIGLLDEGFFMYCEEIDWCWRLRKAGWALFCVPAACIVHHEGQSARAFREQMTLALWRSRFRLYRKHRGPLFQQAARGLVRLGMWAEARRARRQERDAGALARRLATYHEIASL